MKGNCRSPGFFYGDMTGRKDGHQFSGGENGLACFSNYHHGYLLNRKGLNMMVTILSILLMASLGVNVFLMIGRIGLDTKLRVQKKIIEHPSKDVMEIIQDDIYSSAPFGQALQP